MDGIHDLGGLQGFGRIDVDEPEEAFHAPWEGRMFGMARCMARPADWNIDWFRHCRELIDPADYLTRPYYDQWMQAYSAMLVNSGVATVEEIATGKSTYRPKKVPPAPPPESFRTGRAGYTRYDRPGAAEPAFRPGDIVRTKAHGIPGHTRLPRYVRGHRGVIVASHGPHVFPDAHAVGEDRAEPLYTVGFAASDLWPEVTHRDRVFLDLWESYLDRE